ncbi:MAG: PRC-barrel domain-containing protein [Candidatus Rokuibacteriota bacterium]
MKRLIAFAVVAVVVGLPFSTAFGQQQQQTSPGSPGEQQGARQTGAAIASDSLVGTKVRDAQGNDVGQVSKLLIDPNDGKVVSVVIKHGGAFGIGGTEMSVPWNAVKVQRDDRQRLVVTMQREMLEQAPTSEQPAASPATGEQQQRQQPKQE